MKWMTREKNHTKQMLIAHSQLKVEQTELKEKELVTLSKVQLVIPKEWLNKIILPGRTQLLKVVEIRSGLTYYAKFVVLQFVQQGHSSELVMRDIDSLTDLERFIGAITKWIDIIMDLSSLVAGYVRRGMEWLQKSAESKKHCKGSGNSGQMRKSHPSVLSLFMTKLKS